ncbi:unnamed protein product, partial [Musa textilis]
MAKVVGASIPRDVIHYNILPRLPYKSLSTFKCVCKQWHHLISHDLIFAREQSCHGSPISFGYVYQHKRSINFIPVDIPGELNVPIAGSSFFSLPIGVECMRIVAVVNGLLLLLLQRKSDDVCSLNHPDAIDEFYYVWNSVTKEGYVIPKNDHHCWFAGLAFDPAITPACYKVVNLIQQRKGLQEELSLDVYSSRTRKWAMSDRKVLIPHGGRAAWNIFCAGRIIYWACNPYALWFDVEKDVAGCALLPQIETLGPRHVLGATSDGIFTSTQLLRNNAIIIWTMSEDGGWVKKAHLENVPTVSSEFKLFIPLPFTGGDRVYMEMLSYSMQKRMLVCFNMNTQEMTIIREMEGPWPPSKCLYIDYNRIARLG